MNDMTNDCDNQGKAGYQVDGKPRVSVLTTVHNGLPLFSEAVESILAQTFGNWEHVIVDDGSSDGTVEFVKSIGDPRIKLIEAGKVGRGVALNIGLRACRGEFVAVLDADDVCARHRLQHQVELLDRHPEIDLLCGAIVFDQDDLPDAYDPDVKIAILSPNHLVRRNVISHSTCIIRRGKLEAVNGYNEARRFLFDFDLWVRLAQADCVMGFCEIPLAMKRIHDEQSFETNKRLGYLWGGLKIRYAAAASFGESTMDYIYPLVAFVYGLLPRKVRFHLSKRRAIANKYY